MNYPSVKVAISKPVQFIRNFFGDEKVATVFLQMAEYLCAQDTQLVVRTDGTMMGVSRPGERYWFYVAREGNHFYARFCHLRGKKGFPEGKYFSICNDLLAYYGTHAEQFRPVQELPQEQKTQTTAPAAAETKEKREEKPILEKSCENCYLRVSEQCSSLRGVVCEDFSPKLVLSKAEIDLWPTSGDATCTREEYWQRFYRNQST